MCDIAAMQGRATSAPLAPACRPCHSLSSCVWRAPRVATRVFGTTPHRQVPYCHSLMSRACVCVCESMLARAFQLNHEINPAVTHKKSSDLCRAATQRRLRARRSFSSSLWRRCRRLRSSSGRACSAQMAAPTPLPLRRVASSRRLQPQTGAGRHLAMPGQLPRSSPRQQPRTQPQVRLLTVANPIGDVQLVNALCGPGYLWRWWVHTTAHAGRAANTGSGSVLWCDGCICPWCAVCGRRPAQSPPHSQPGAGHPGASAAARDAA